MNNVKATTSFSDLNTLVKLNVNSFINVNTTLGIELEDATLEFHVPYALNSRLHGVNVGKRSTINSND